jgi:hypothetical protein
MEERNELAAILALREESLDNNNHLINKVVGKQLSMFGFSTTMIHEVMNEVCIRAAQRPKQITDPEAWFKGTSLNVIREMSRYRKRIEPKDSEDHCFSISLDEPEDSNDVMINGFTIDHYSPYLKKAWDELLSDDDRFILSVKILKDKNWREVSEAISLYNGKLTTESTTRQKGNRAIKKLREAIADLQTTGETQ